MNARRLLEDAAAENSLGEVLARCAEVTKYDAGDHREAWALAHAFSDLEECFRAFLERQLPKLTQAEGPPEARETYDLLLEIGEEFRHVLYHLNNLSFYSYLRDGERQ